MPRGDKTKGTKTKIKKVKPARQQVGDYHLQFDIPGDAAKDKVIKPKDVFEGFKANKIKKS